MGLDAIILVFWMLSFKPTFSLSSFTFNKRLFSSLLSAIRVVSSHIWGYWYFPRNLDSSLIFMNTMKIFSNRKMCQKVQVERTNLKMAKEWKIPENIKISSETGNLKEFVQRIKDVKAIWLWHLSPPRSPGLIWLIWLYRQVFPSSLTTPCVSL